MTMTKRVDPVVFNEPLVPPPEPFPAIFPDATRAIGDPPLLIVTPGLVAVSDRLSVIAIVQPVPAPLGTVNVALHVPVEAENPAGVDDPEQPPPHVAVEMLVGAVPV